MFNAEEDFYPTIAFPVSRAPPHKSKLPGAFALSRPSYKNDRIGSGSVHARVVIIYPVRNDGQLRDYNIIVYHYLTADSHFQTKV